MAPILRLSSACPFLLLLMLLLLELVSPGLGGSGSGSEAGSGGEASSSFTTSSPQTFKQGGNYGRLVHDLDAFNQSQLYDLLIEVLRRLDLLKSADTCYHLQKIHFNDGGGGGGVEGGGGGGGALGDGNRSAGSDRDKGDPAQDDLTKGKGPTTNNSAAPLSNSSSSSGKLLTLALYIRATTSANATSLTTTAGGNPSGLPRLAPSSPSQDVWAGAGAPLSFSSPTSSSSSSSASSLRSVSPPVSTLTCGGHGDVVVSNDNLALSHSVGSAAGKSSIGPARTDSSGPRAVNVSSSEGPGPVGVEQQAAAGAYGLERSHIVVLSTCSAIIFVFFVVALFLRVRNYMKRVREEQLQAQRPTFRSCSVRLRSVSHSNEQVRRDSQVSKLSHQSNMAAARGPGAASYALTNGCPSRDHSNASSPRHEPDTKPLLLVTAVTEVQAPRSPSVSQSSSLQFIDEEPRIVKKPERAAGRSAGQDNHEVRPLLAGSDVSTRGAHLSPTSPAYPFPFLADRDWGDSTQPECCCNCATQSDVTTDTSGLHDDDGNDIRAFTNGAMADSPSPRTSCAGGDVSAASKRTKATDAAPEPRGLLAPRLNDVSVSDAPEKTDTPGRRLNREPVEGNSSARGLPETAAHVPPLVRFCGLTQSDSSLSSQDGGAGSRSYSYGNQAEYAPPPGLASRVPGGGVTLNGLSWALQRQALSYLQQPHAAHLQLHAQRTAAGGSHGYGGMGLSAPGSTASLSVGFEGGDSGHKNATHPARSPGDLEAGAGALPTERSAGKVEAPLKRALSLQQEPHCEAPHGPAPTMAQAGKSHSVDQAPGRCGDSARTAPLRSSGSWTPLASSCSSSDSRPLMSPPSPAPLTGLSILHPITPRSRDSPSPADCLLNCQPMSEGAEDFRAIPTAGQTLTPNDSQIQALSPTAPASSLDEEYSPLGTLASPSRDVGVHQAPSVGMLSLRDQLITNHVDRSPNAGIPAPFNPPDTPVVIKKFFSFEDDRTTFL